jgi:transposase
VNVRDYHQNQSLAFPPHIRQFLPDDHPAVIINDIVNTMDLSRFFKKISSEGRQPYHPAMMLKILIYAYSNGIFSSRKIQKALQESVAFIFLAAWRKPDFRTISDFRKDNLCEIKTVFSQLLEYCQRMQMISLGHVSIDGTRIKANAADRHTWHRDKINKKINKLLKKADQTDSEEDATFGQASGDEVPAPVRKQKDRLEELKKIKKELEASGKSNLNTTDSDASLMKSRGGLTTGFNAQVAVEEQNQLIVAEDVTNDPADTAQLAPVLEQVEKNVGKPEILTADSGYGSGENLRLVEKKEIDGYIPDPVFQGGQRKSAEEQSPFAKSRFIRDEDRDCFICPAGQALFFSHTYKDKKNLEGRVYQCKAFADCPFRNECSKGSKGRIISLTPYEKELKHMRQKLDSKTGKLIYKKRQTLVEPVFATLKCAIGFSRFSLRGLQKVRAEFTLLCIAHNFRKLVTFLMRQKSPCLGAA